ncbi:MAG: response regulator [Deltaproteobacteria bacterium]|jgi:putative two-component system response regulator|nr:response regulator [Deltaproteobacteria bacterium]
MIVIVDDNISNLRLAKNALEGFYDVFTLPSGEKLMNFLERHEPKLILLDIEMPGINGYQVISMLKRNPATRHIPVIFLTSKTDEKSELDGLNLGAVDYIYKPFMPQLLRKRIELHLAVDDQKQVLEAQALQLENQRLELQRFKDSLHKMVLEKTAKVYDVQKTILKIVATLVESRHTDIEVVPALGQERLDILINSMKELNIYRDQIEQWDFDLMLLSSQLHDLGKITIADDIIKKNDKLTVHEYETIKTHTSQGVNLIDRVAKTEEENDFLKFAKIFAGTHHEKWDGSGYPKGLSGEQIPLPGRLMAIVDVYDALISKRAYKRQLTHEEAVKVIVDGRGTHFDPFLVDVFVHASDKFRNLV